MYIVSCILYHVYCILYIVSCILYPNLSFLGGLMLYSLCMKFQAELVNFQDQLENRVLRKTFSSRQNSEVQPSVTTHEDLKMYSNDLITHILHQFCVYSINTIIYMQQNRKPFWLFRWSIQVVICYRHVYVLYGLHDSTYVYIFFVFYVSFMILSYFT